VNFLLLRCCGFHMVWLGMAESQIQAEADATLVEDPGSGEKLSAKRKSKPRVHRPIVESLHIRTMAASYKHHIAVYSKDREQVNQIIPSTVWKAVYAHYLKQFPNSPFVEETLKDRLRETVKEMQTGRYVEEEEPEKAALQSDEVVARLKDRLRETLKELRTGTFNEEDFEKAVLQSDEVFQDFEKASLKTSLRASEEHATRSALKRKLGLIDGTSTPVTGASRNLLEAADVAPTSYCIMSGSLAPTATLAPDAAPASNCMHPGSLAPSATSGPGSMPSPHLSSTSPPLEKVMTKAEMLQQQSRSIAAIATQFLSNSEKRDALLAAEVDYHRAKSDYYNEKTRKLKIGNLKLLRESGVISEEAFKQQVKLV
jgi:hypothetical protein